MSWIVADDTSPLYQDPTSGAGEASREGPRQGCSVLAGEAVRHTRRRSASGSAARKHFGPVASICVTCGKRFGARARFCPFDGEPLGPDALGQGEDPLLGVDLGGRYRVDRLLGEGGMGRVYRVTHVGLSRPMAAKVLRPELVAVSDLSARFLAEARAAAAIEHPNVVRLLDFGTLPGGRPFFVMELLGGEPLRALIGVEPMEPGRVVHIARQVAAGLGAAHRAGIVHRDLKPDNVQVDEEAGDFATVLDFGLARVAGAARLTGQGVVFGTPQYMSPEQAAGEPLDRRTDIYALGVMMYEMLTGQVPFESPTFMGLLQQHLHEPGKPLAQVLPGRELGGLESIVSRCLAQRPDQRFSTMEEVIVALDAVALDTAARARLATKGGIGTREEALVLPERTLARDTGAAAAGERGSSRRSSARTGRGSRGAPAVGSAALALGFTGLAVGALVAWSSLDGSKTGTPHVDPAIQPARAPRGRTFESAAAPPPARLRPPASTAPASGAAPTGPSSTPHDPSTAMAKDGEAPPSERRAVRAPAARIPPVRSQLVRTPPRELRTPRPQAAPAGAPKVYQGEIIDPWAEPREPLP